MFRQTSIRIFSLALVLIGLHAGSAWSQCILIFSTTHNNSGSSLLSTADGILKAVVSAFESIEELRADGKAQQVQSSSATTRLKVPYQIQAGENSTSKLAVRAIVMREKTG